MDTISVSPVDETTEAFESLYALYTASFPLSEQKPKEALRALLGDPDYSVFVLEKGESVAGFAVFFRPLDEPFWLLEYMAIDPLARGEGLGGLLFSRSLGLMGKWFGPRTLLVEIDAPPGAPQSAEHRRERFYRRAGCRKIEGFDYILGLKTSPPPPPMQMMLLDPGRSEIGRDELRGYIETLYRRVYGRPADDPRIRRMFRDLPDTLMVH